MQVSTKNETVSNKRTDTREIISSLLEERNFFKAIEVIKNWLSGDKNIAKYSFVANLIENKHHNNSFKKVKVALISSFTNNNIKPFLEVEAFLNNVFIETYFCGYNQWRQELLINGSALDRFKPDIVIVMVHLEDLSPMISNQFFLMNFETLNAEMERVLFDLTNPITIFRGRSTSPIILQNFMIPKLTLSSQFDCLLDNGLAMSVATMNRKIASIVKSIHGVAILDYENLTASFGKTNWTNLLLSHVAKSPIDLKAMPFLALEIIKMIKSILFPKLKCIVTDLDNTLWGGIVGEDGITGIKLGPDYPGSAYVDFQHFLLQMKSLGVLLVINSRNNFEDVRTVFEQHPHCAVKLKDFAAYRINWNDKSENLLEIAKELNLGLDSLIFIDDNIFECERVRSSLPEVTVVNLASNPVDFPSLVLDSGNYFSYKITDDDRRRSQLYEIRNKVQETMKSARSIEDFIKGLDMELVIKKATSVDANRVAQLTQKTNQFNLTNRRYQESEISKFLLDDTSEVFALSLKDRFGDYGIVGVIIIIKKEPSWIIDTFLLSCRIIGRTLEDVVITFVKNLAVKNNIKQLVGEYCPSSKNSMVRELYRNSGFKIYEENEKIIKWQISLSQQEQYSKYIKVVIE